MKEVSVNELSVLTGCTRETVGKKLEGVTFKEGPKGAKLYDSEKALRLVLGVAEINEKGEVMSQAEANRQLTIARKEQIGLEMEVLRKERPRIEEVLEVFDDIFDDVAGIVKSSDLSDDQKIDIMSRIKEGRETIEPDEPAITVASVRAAA
jgi:hypothetical protein